MTWCNHVVFAQFHFFSGRIVCLSLDTATSWACMCHTQSFHKLSCKVWGGLQNTPCNGVHCSSSDLSNSNSLLLQSEENTFIWTDARTGFWYVNIDDDSFLNIGTHPISIHKIHLENDICQNFVEILNFDRLIHVSVTYLKTTNHIGIDSTDSSDNSLKYQNWSCISKQIKAVGIPLKGCDVFLQWPHVDSLRTP